MELMNGAEFKQTQVVIGQQTKTRGFSVSDDPMLMSILSTGLYQKPLKSMIQEAVFNAWDAHIASGNKDKPIEIIFTDDHQLIISDSGYGIAPDDMYEIYCVYGASTKRVDNDQTGGFGLGCKAPFAYTDSFRVTSSHKGKRHLYLVSRANDDNDGKPGITELVGGLDCDQSGLIVSIPLKNKRDAEKAYEILKNKIFPYSGIKWTLAFEDHNLEEGQEDYLEPGKFVIEPGRMNPNKGLIAQYGGIAYPVPYTEEYASEYNFLANCIGSVGSIRVGFSAGTLTPLPSREGLNLSELTTENLRIQIQAIIDELNLLIQPMMELAVNWVAHCLGDTDNELYDNFGDHYDRTPFAQFCNAGFNNDFDDVLTREQVNQYLNEPLPENCNKELVTRLREVIMLHTCQLIKSVGTEWFHRRRAIAWSVQNGHNRERFDILRYGNTSDHFSGEKLTTRINQRTIEQVIDNLIRVSDHVKVKPHLRIRSRHDYQSTRYTFVAEENEPNGYRKSQTYQKLRKEKKHLSTTRVTLDTLRPTQGSRSGPKSLDSVNVILAHTIKDGNHFEPSDEHFSKQRGRKIPILVIGTSVAKMDKAQEFLEARGCVVVQAPKYVEPEFSPEALSEPKFQGWPRLNRYEEGFASNYSFTLKPTMYLQYSKTQQQSEQYIRDRLNSNGIHAISQYFAQEQIVVINHPNKLKAMEKLGIDSVSERIEALVKTFLADPDFAKKLAMHKHAREYGSIPDGLLQLPEFSKVLGLPYLRTRELVDFRRALELLDTIATCDSEVFCSADTRTLIQTQLTPDVSLVARPTAVLRALKVLDGHEVQNVISEMTDGEKKVYAEKLARFIRTTAV